MGNVFGQQFRSLREEAGLSQRELARRLGHATTNYLYDVENGVFIPRDDGLRKLAAAMGLPLNQLRGMVLEAKVQDLGIKEPGFVSMLKDYPRLSRTDKHAIVEAYLQIRAKKGWTR